MEVTQADLQKAQDERVRGTEKVDFTKAFNPAIVAGKTALITGGAAGIGLGVGRALAENGARIAICDLNSDAGEQTEQELCSQGFSAKFVKTDTSSWDSQLAAFKQVLKWSSNQLDIVVMAAGITGKPFAELIDPKNYAPGEDPPKPPTDVFDINPTGVYFSTILALFYMNSLLSQHQDSQLKPQLLFISSAFGYDVASFTGDYCSAKFGVRGLWKTVRRPGPGMADYQANLLMPTWTRTGINDPWYGILEKVQMPIAEVADVVAAAMRCICDERVSGRAIASPKTVSGSPGSENFDLCDDLGDYGAGKPLLDNLLEGKFGYVFSF